jgi:multicomponent K+:H+ antiporter subunit A
MFFDQTLDLDLLGGVDWLLPAAATLAGTFAVAYSLRFIHDVFFNGEPVDLPRTPHEPPRWMRIPVEILVGLCLLVGILPQQTVRPFLDVGAASMLGSLPTFDLAIWHGFNAPLLMSVIALGAGALVYASRHWLFATHDRLLPRSSAEATFERGAALLLNVSHRIMAWADNRSLQRYAVWLVVVVLVLTAAPLVMHGWTLDGGLAGEPVDGVSVVAALLVAAAAIGTVVAARRQRLLALIMTSIVGLVVSLTFIHFSAPDLALTQLSVEVVTTILLLLVLYLLPLGEIRPTPRWRQVRDLGLATLAGLGTAALAFAMMTRGYEPISRYFLEFAKPHGGGTNVVNVILVDFRGFDTWGEITVLGIAAAGIYAMLRGLRLKAPTRGIGGRPWSHDVHPLILAMISRPLLPLALLVSVYILLRGHNLPGGGFIAGLVAGTALILQQLASGQQWTGERMRLGYFTLIGLGLALATGTGLAALIFGRPFLTSAFTYLHLPLIGKVEVASAMAFDLGVFLVVVGTVMLILENLGKLTSGHTQTPPVQPGEER